MDINYSGQLRETLTIIESNSDFLSISSDIFDFAASDQRQYPRVSDFVDEFDKNPDQFRAWLSGLASYLRLARFRNVPMEVVVPSRSSDRSNRQHKFPQYHIMVKQAYRSSLHVNIPGRDNGVVTACDVALFVQGIIREITHRTCPIILVLDHKGCFESITSVAEVKERMQSLYINRLREHLAKREIERVVWVPATAQMANILTKRVSTKEKRSFLLNLQVNKVDPPKGAIVRSGSLAVVGNKEREENPGEYQINNQIERAQRTAAQPVHHKH
eukprot:CAMPEP_0184692826 /NCGR_PEP_ID=MMETSP0313-20130426/1156_1 /TAXON_ID=2792 /ORGANISM="Porphyridium aerugineum, Strain SAG 1380-2" /LENGTH=272 /DNA_ID=CAMNT_0027150699 /DNA_START=245 /DNA_END=1064 /DNA_ORIENTATION=-